VDAWSTVGGCKKVTTGKGDKLQQHSWLAFTINTPFGRKNVNLLLNNII
jgi:hypothetical protein